MKILVIGSGDAIRMQKIIDMLEDLDDVQQVYTNVIINE